MVIALYDVTPPESKDLTIVVRNHRDGVVGILPPGVAILAFGGRWLDRGSKCTEIDVTNTYGRSATITLEDDGNYGLCIAGNVQNGMNRFRVNGSKGFNLSFTSDGAIELLSRDGNWGDSLSSVIRLSIPAFVR